MRYADELPIGCHGVTVVDHEGFANIYLNPKYDQGHQEAAFRHEVAHVANNDAFNEDSLEVIEARAKGALPPLPPGEVYAAFLERSYARGLELFGLQRNDPFWPKLFDIWDFRTHKDRYEGVIANGIDRYNRRQTGHMVNRIFRG